MGFKISLYNPCAADKMINGSQITVTWHVNDLKISHVDDAEVTEFVMTLSMFYGHRLSVARGKLHLYLEMDF